jgi:hypothetical protein
MATTGGFPHIAEVQSLPAPDSLTELVRVAAGAVVPMDRIIPMMAAPKRMDLVRIFVFIMGFIIPLACAFQSQSRF